MLGWTLPAPLKNRPDLRTEVNWGHGWVDVASGDHLPVHFENEESTLDLRFTHKEWVGVATITIPALPTVETTFPTVETTPIGVGLTQEQTLGLVYGVTIGGLVLLCVIVLSLVLVLKHVQGSRRENDKGETAVHNIIYMV